LSEGSGRHPPRYMPSLRGVLLARGSGLFESLGRRRRRGSRGRRRPSPGSALHRREPVGLSRCPPLLAGCHSRRTSLRTRKVVIRPAHRMAVRPRVIINAAMSVDGKIALPDGKGVRLSNEEDLRRVHRLRAAVDAILVGVGTVLKDDPKLTVKSEYAKGRNPLRVVLDSDGKIPDSAHVLDGSAPTLIVTSEESDRSFPRAEVMRLGRDEVDLEALLDRLAARDVKTILVEGGSTVIWSFLRKGLADEVKVFVSSRVLGGQAAPTLAGGQGVISLDEAPRLRLDRIERLGDGALLEYTVVR